MLLGLVSFDENGDRLLNYNIVNLQPGTTQLQVVGTWDAQNGVNLVTLPVWADGTTNIPTDGLFSSRFNIYFVLINV